MFTGLIQAVCTVTAVTKNADSMALTIDLADLAGQTQIGDSIAVNGVCLTVASLKATKAAFDVSGETMKKSTLKNLKISQMVNIELAMTPADRFGGHFVLGHIDSTAAIKTIQQNGRFTDIKFSASAELLEMMVPKGSVAVDGISLTIAQLDANGFTVAVIPQTWQNTTLSEYKVGDMVNIETDIITKNVKRQLGKILPKKSELTIEKLKNLGF